MTPLTQCSISEVEFTVWEVRSGCVLEANSGWSSRGASCFPHFRGGPLFAMRSGAQSRRLAAARG